MGDFSEGLASVRIGDYWGFVNETGAVVIEPRFTHAASFSNGLARISFKSPEYGYIAHSGVIVIQPQFAFAESFSEEVAVVAANIQGPYWFIHKNGTPAFPEKFALASSFVKGLAHVKLFSSNRDESDPSSGRYAYIERTGKTVFRYDR